MVYVKVYEIEYSVMIRTRVYFEGLFRGLKGVKTSQFPGT